jgi:hypothetical protein
MEYYSKYLKYKQKYLELKNNMTGGAFPFKFGYGTTFYIMAKITGETLDRVKERRKKLFDKNLLNVGVNIDSELHITLLQLHINLEHPNHKIFYDLEFINIIKESYRKNIKDSNVSLSSVKTDAMGNVLGGKWDFFGMNDFSKKYWARVYDLPEKYQKNMKDFRIEIYNFLNIRYGIKRLKREFRGKGTDITEFEIYGTPDGNELYAIVVDHYLGVSKWKPHISVVRMNEIIPSIVTQMEQQDFDTASEYIRDTIGSVKPMSTINFARDVNILKIALNQPNGLKIGLPTITEFKESV